MKKASIVLLFCLFGFLSFVVNAQSECTPTIAASDIAIYPSTGGTYGIDIRIGTNCNWTATSNVDGSNWVHILSPNAINGVFNYRVDANTGTARSTFLTVAGHILTIYQDGQVVQPTLINLRVKVVDANYKDIRNASVSFTNTATGETRMTQSNPFGWVLFSNVTNGQTYRIEIKHKRYTFITFNTVFDNNSVSIAFVAEP